MAFQVISSARKVGPAQKILQLTVHTQLCQVATFQFAYHGPTGSLTGRSDIWRNEKSLTRQAAQATLPLQSMVTCSDLPSRKDPWSCWCSDADGIFWESSPLSWHKNLSHEYHESATENSCENSKWSMSHLQRTETVGFHVGSGPAKTLDLHRRDIESLYSDTCWQGGQGHFATTFRTHGHPGFRCKLMSNIFRDLRICELHDRFINELRYENLWSKEYVDWS